MAEIYGEIPSGLKTTLIAPLVRALHEARLPLYEIEGRAFTVHVTSSEKTKSVVPWYEIVTEVRSLRVVTANGCQRAAQIKKDSTPDEEQPAADKEKPKGSKSIKESTKKAAGTVKDVGKKISDKVKGEKAKLSDGERLASRSKRPAVSLFRACLQLTVLSQTRTSCARCRRRASRPSPSPAAKAAPM